MATGSVPTTNVSPVVDELVAQKYMGKKWENLKRLNPVLEFIDKNGNVRFDASGEYVEIIGEVGEYVKSQRSDLEARSFARKQHYATWRFPWSWHEVTGALSERDIALLKSPDAIYDRQKRELTKMGKDFHRGINSDILTKNAGSNTSLGQAVNTGSDIPLYGLPTIFDPGATATTWDPVARTTATTTTLKASSKERLPQGTYGGITTNPTTAIAGVDNKYFESTSPVIVNAKATDFSSTATWAANCTLALSYINSRLMRGQGMDERADLAITNQADYLALKAKLRSEVSQQVVIYDKPTEPDAGMYPRSFLDYEGIKVMFDLSCPASTMYVLNSSQLYFSAFPQSAVPGVGTNGPIGGNAGAMFMTEVQKDIDQGAWKIVCQMAGQLFANPYYQGVIYSGF
jgi:hypothetical protein